MTSEGSRRLETAPFSSRSRTYILRCLGAALIMQWNALPTVLQREIFDAAGAVGRPVETAELRGRLPDFCTTTRMIPVAANCL